MNDERLMSAVEVARLLHLHVNTVKRIAAADLPYVAVTRRGDHRYWPQDVAAYLRERTRR